MPREFKNTSRTSTIGAAREKTTRTEETRQTKTQAQRKAKRSGPRDIRILEDIWCPCGIVIVVVAAWPNLHQRTPCIDNRTFGKKGWWLILTLFFGCACRTGHMACFVWCGACCPVCVWSMRLALLLRASSVRAISTLLVVLGRRHLSTHRNTLLAAHACYELHDACSISFVCSSCCFMLFCLIAVGFRPTSTRYRLPYRFRLSHGHPVSSCQN